MEDEVLRKLRGALSQPLNLEKDAVYILVMVRKALEHLKPSKPYPMLDFFCSWALHVKLNGDPAKRIVSIVDGVLSTPITRIEEFDLGSKLGSLLNFDPFLAELDAFLHANGLPRLLITDIYERQIFLNLYVDIVGDCTLSSRDTNKAFKIVEFMKVKRNYEPKPLTEANPHMFHFTYDWFFAYKDGQYLTLPSTHSLMMQSAKWGSEVETSRSSPLKDDPLPQPGRMLGKRAMGYFSLNASQRSVHVSRHLSMGITRYFAVVALLASYALGQAVVDVVSLRSHPAGAAHGAIRIRPDGVAGDNVTLRQLIRFAYELQDAQIFGPDWIGTDGFDIEATAIERPTPEQVRTAFQKLLTDRFKLRSHREKKELPGYRMVVAATGAKLRDPKEEASFNAALAGKPPFKEGFVGMFTSKDLPGFAERLSRGIGRIVVDDTGINGQYWFQLEWVPDRGQLGIDGPSLRAAIREQVGLELIDGNVLAEAFVIDSVERRP